MVYDRFHYVLKYFIYFRVTLFFYNLHQIQRVHNFSKKLEIFLIPVTNVWSNLI